MFESRTLDTENGDTSPPLSAYARHAGIFRSLQLVEDKDRAVKAARETKQVASDKKFGRLYGASLPMRKVYNLIEKVASSDASVLVVGENGCGKELVVETIHEMSRRSNRPLLAINCGALPATLIEAELFGYEKGAFTGAQKAHCGFFERARGGTLFLDEITEMPLDLQVRLLRVLESRQVSRLGGEQEIELDVRILAATNRDPMEAVRDNQLREDLFYRLAEFPITLPPLRERGDDIILLAHHFLQQVNAQYGTDKEFAADAEEKLRLHTWPGNVRELKNCIQRAYLMADRKVDFDILSPFHAPMRTASGHSLEFPVGISLMEVERELIFATLGRYHGNKRRAAEVLGISLKTIYNKLNSYLVDGKYNAEEADMAALGQPDKENSSSSRNASCVPEESLSEKERI